MATSGDSDDKILFFNNNGHPESNPMLLNPMKKYDHKKHLLKVNKEKDLINKVRCFTQNDNHEVWSATKLLFWFAKDQHWVEIK